MKKRTREVGIVIKDEKVLLIHRIHEGHEYNVFPGGGVESEETIEEAVVRELYEEASIKARVNKILYHHHITDTTGDSDQYFCLCDYISGEPKLGEANESKDMEKGL